MALLTMALLTMALLTMALLTMALLTMALLTIEVGTLTPGKQRPTEQLRAGEVGYMHGAIKQACAWHVHGTGMACACAQAGCRP